jgi:hypothetical protein
MAGGWSDHWPADRACEDEPGGAIDAELDAGRLPDLDTLSPRFAQHLTAIPRYHRRGGGAMTSSALSSVVRHNNDRFRRHGPRRAASRELRLPAAKQVWASLAAQADQEGWPAGRFIGVLAEHEIAERSRRRLERHLAEALLGLGYL